MAKSEAQRQALGSAAYPLAGLYFLEHGATHTVRPMDRTGALGQIVHNLTHFFRWLPEDASRAAFDTAVDLVRRVEPLVLSFARDEGFWNVLE